MKKAFLLVLTAVVLSSAATTPRQPLPKELQDGGGTEPPCLPCLNR